jgi:hypothetical protein
MIDAPTKIELTIHAKCGHRYNVKAASGPDGAWDFNLFEIDFDEKPDERPRHEFHSGCIQVDLIDTPAPKKESAMTDRHAGYVVVLNTDRREDDSEATLAAIRQIKGVLSVRPVEATYEVHIAEERADQVWRDRVLDMLGRAR